MEIQSYKEVDVDEIFFFLVLVVGVLTGPRRLANPVGEMKIARIVV